MRIKLTAMTFMTLAFLGSRVLAHEGHEHRIMGKVVTVDEKSIAVESVDGEQVTGVLGVETKYMRDKAAVARTDVKIGERVVIVIVEGKNKVQNVKQVQLGAAATAEHKDEPHKH